MSNSELAITYLLQSSYVMTALIVCLSAYFILLPIPAHPASYSGRIRPLIPEYPAKGAAAPLVA